jgi:hypothetical protein
MKASFVPGRLIVNKIKDRRFTLAGFVLLSPSGFRRLRLSANVWWLDDGQVLVPQILNAAAAA